MIRERRMYPKTLMQKRKTAIIALVIAIALLIPTLVFIISLVRTFPYYDTDGTKYLLKYHAGEYALYNTDGERLKTDPEYGYYITDIGTLVSVDAAAGTVNEIIIPDTEYTEVTHEDYPTRLMMFGHITKAEILSIDVVNSESTFSFQRYNPVTDALDSTSSFIIKEAPFVGFSEEKFAKLYVDAGYTVVKQKIVDPIKDEQTGEFFEYGLAPETRVDEEGKEYEYVPAYFILTDVDGNKHKVIVGDELVDGSGYYAQYVDISGETEVKRDAVYVLANTVGDTVLATVEDYVTPTIVYPMTINSYLFVDDFLITKRDPYYGSGRRNVVGFSFVPTEDRAGTLLENFNFEFDIKAFEGYIPDADNIQACLNNLYDTDFAGVAKVRPSNEDLVKYGLAVEKVNSNGEKVYDYDSEYAITFVYDVLDDKGNTTSRLKHLILISEPNESGNYYAYTLIYDGAAEENTFLYSFDTVVEVNAHAFDFLTWDSYRWINSRFMSLAIPFCQNLKVETNSAWTNFFLDNSMSVQVEGQPKNTNNLKVDVTDSKGEDFSTFGGLTVIDQAGNIWTVTPAGLTAKSSAGAELTITNSYYAYNSIGRRVKAITAPIVCADGTTVEVNADTVVVVKPGGESITYNRFGTTLFRNFYEALVSTTIEGAYEMTDEQEQALLSNPSKHLMTITVKTTENTENVYSFYSLTSRKAYLTINGNGGFYVNATRVQKILNDVDRFMNNEEIDYSSKN